MSASNKKCRQNYRQPYIILLKFAVLFCHDVCYISSFVPGRPNAFQPMSSKNSRIHDRWYASTYTPTTCSTIPFIKPKISTELSSSSTKEGNNDQDDEQEQRQRQNPQLNINSSENNKNRWSSGLNGQRQSEFNVSEKREITPQHQKRLQELKHIENTFVPYGDKLWELRSTLIHLSKQLIHIIAAKNQNGIGSTEMSSSMHSIVSEEEIREMIREVESKDPEYVYALEKEKMERALEDGRDEDVKNHKEKALIARSALPHFNLHGLWVGK